MYNLFRVVRLLRERGALERFEPRRRQAEPGKRPVLSNAPEGQRFVDSFSWRSSRLGGKKRVFEPRRRQGRKTEPGKRPVLSNAPERQGLFVSLSWRSSCLGGKNVSMNRGGAKGAKQRVRSQRTGCVGPFGAFAEAERTTPSWRRMDKTWVFCERRQTCAFS
ncbi:hypothetical protein LSAC_00436 [Levilinea saccharolytica]|nr:hypothetical protein LSAC_00436 [Levilinea saccharolytica]